MKKLHPPGPGVREPVAFLHVTLMYFGDHPITIQGSYSSFLLPHPVLLSSEELHLEQALKRSTQNPWWPGYPKNSGLA